MAVVRNNSVGELSVSSAQTSQQYRIDSGDNRVFTSDPLYVQGMKHIAIQAEEYGTNINQVTIDFFGAIAQEGGNPDFFLVKSFLLSTGAGKSFIFENLILPVQFIKFESSVPIGSPDVLYRIRLMASQ